MHINTHTETQPHRPSQHAVVPPLIIDWLCKHGSRIHGLNGTTICFFDCNSRRSLSAEVGSVIVRRLSDLMDVYLIMSGDSILSVGRNYKPLTRRTP
jgi:hypothetical protein